MSIEAVLLLIESVLLVVTVALLIYSIREGRRRNLLILEVGKATRTLTRMEYHLTVTDSMTEAREEIIGYITGRRPSGGDEKMVKAILGAVEKAKSRGVRVKYLLPKFQDRLYMGHLYTTAGAEVKYGASSTVHSLRYVVVDEKLVVIGIPERIGGKEATRKGHRLPSEALASILREHFYSCWQENITFEEYALEVLKQTGASIEHLAHELGMEAKELEGLLAKTPHQAQKTG